MDELFAQIAAAANDGLYFLALAGALSVPDICGALEAADGQASGNRYRAWFDTHVAPKHDYGSGVSIGHRFKGSMTRRSNRHSGRRNR